MLMPTNSLSVQSVTVYLCALKFLPNQNLSFGLEHSNMIGLNASVKASTLDCVRGYRVSYTFSVKSPPSSVAG